VIISPAHRVQRFLPVTESPGVPDPWGTATAGSQFI